MPDTKDDDNPELQRRDQWGVGFQNEYGRILGRIESKLDDHGEKLKDLKNENRNADKSRLELTERVRQNAHKANNDLQNVSMRLEKAQVTIDTTKIMVEQVGVQVTGVEGRVRKLEAPVTEAMEQRTKRRARLQRYWLWMAPIGLALWAGLGEPVWRAIMPGAIQRWFSITLPPH